MSTETNVNRVSTGFNVEAEIAKLDPPAVPEAETTPALLKQDPATMANAFEALDIEQEDPEDTLGNTISGITPADTFNSLIVSRVEFEKFRTQVIMAFKHSGLDTRKYFGA